MAAAAQVLNNKLPKQIKTIIECCANTCKPWWKDLKMFAKFECARKNLSKSPRCEIRQEPHGSCTSKQRQCTSNRRQLKTKIYEKLCECVKSVGIKLLKWWFSFVCGADGPYRAVKKNNAQIIPQLAHGSCYTSVKQQTTKANFKN